MASRLKRLLRPLRPVLLPIWRPLRPYLDTRPGGPTLRLRAARGAAAIDRWLRRLTHRIRPLTRLELEQLAASERYYRGRVRYLSVAAAEASDLIRRRHLSTALELGPHLRPLIVGADVMILKASPDMEAEGTVIAHDARVIPWPMADGAYDLFVALQVFEHLGTSQPAAFREVCRIARHAIVSLPIDWVKANPADCHHGITEATVLAWFAPRVPTRIVEGNPAPGRRVIYVFEDLGDEAGNSGHGAAPRAG